MIKADLRIMKSMLKKIHAIGVEEALMTIGDQKLHGRYVDPAHVAMLDMTMKLKNCKCEPITFGIDLATLTSRINLLPAGNIKKRDNPENQLKIKILRKKGELIGFEFLHPMLEFQKSLMNVACFHESKFPKGILERIDATADINTRQFRIFLKIAEAEIDHITFIAEQETNSLLARFINDEEETVSTDLTYSLGGIEGIDLQFLNKDVKTIKAIFSVDYMVSTINLINAPIIKIGLRNDNPLVIWWNEQDLLGGIYMLAPRIQSE